MKSTGNLFSSLELID